MAGLSSQPCSPWPLDATTSCVGAAQHAGLWCLPSRGAVRGSEAFCLLIGDWESPMKRSRISEVDDVFAPTRESVGRAGLGAPAASAATCSYTPNQGVNPQQLARAAYYDHCSTTPPGIVAQAAACDQAGQPYCWERHSRRVGMLPTSRGSIAYGSALDSNLAVGRVPESSRVPAPMGTGIQAPCDAQGWSAGGARGSSTAYARGVHGSWEQGSDVLVAQVLPAYSTALVLHPEQPQQQELSAAYLRHPHIDELLPGQQVAHPYRTQEQLQRAQSSYMLPRPYTSAPQQQQLERPRQQLPPLVLRPVNLGPSVGGMHPDDAFELFGCQAVMLPPSQQQHLQVQPHSPPARPCTPLAHLSGPLDGSPAEWLLYTCKALELTAPTTARLALHLWHRISSCVRVVAAVRQHPRGQLHGLTRGRHHHQQRQQHLIFPAGGDGSGFEVGSGSAASPIECAYAAACIWLGAKLEERRREVPSLQLLAAAAHTAPGVLSAMEIRVLEWCEWSPYRSYLPDDAHMLVGI